MNMKRILPLLTAAALMVSMTACNSDATPQPSEAAGVAVQTTLVVADTIATENRVSGQVVSDSQTMVMVGTSAKCTAVYAEAGDEVEKGDLICTLDMGSMLANYKAAKINYNATVKSYNDQKAILDAQLAQTEKQVSDLKELLAIGAVAQADVDSAELGLMQLKAQRDSALSQLEAGMQSGKSSLEQLEQVMEDVDDNGNIIAPVSGTLVSMSATENGYVSNSAPVAIIDSNEQRKVSVMVSEALVSQLTPGDEAEVTISAVNQTLTGTISAVDRSPNYQTKLYMVTLELPEGTEGILAGMFADVTFRTDFSADTIVIPSEAILTSSGVNYVFIVEGETARRADVTTGLTGSGVTEITSGLSVGQQLVVMGQAYLDDGAAVRVVEG